MAAMTEAQAAPLHVVDPALIQRNRVLGILLLVLAAIIAGVFGLDAHGNARFNISPARAAVPLPPLIVPSAVYIYVVAALIAFLGVRLLMRTNSKFGNLMLGLGLALFVTAFLTWATDERSLSLIGLLQSAVVRAVPIAFAGLAGVLCERVGVTNIGIEGMMLSGAFTGAVAGSVFGGEIGLVAATLVGGGMGLVLALLTVTYRLDHIIAGVVINMLALGITSYASSQILTVHRELNDAPIFRAIEIPVLSEIPIIGPMFFSHNLFVYAAVIMILSATYYLFHTRLGLRARSVGEHPRAADTLGINVFSVRYINVIVGGMVAGFGGAYFTLGAVGQFEENMTAGRGYIGLAAMIFGRWHPLGVLAAALVFGFFDTLQQKLVILSTPVPSEFLAMAPYVVTIIVVAGLVGRARAPAADGTNYVKA